MIKSDERGKKMQAEYKLKTDYMTYTVDANLIYEDDNSIYLSGSNTITQLFKHDLEYITIKGR